MNKPLLIIAGTLIASLFFITAKAQTDSVNYDLGRIRLKKSFTQSITIKGSDLERYQFADLSDAINVWLYGTYTNVSSVVFMVDGNIITDVNAYSIYDIDEITLVQNAAAQVSGASPTQQLVLIKTRTGGPGKQGVTAAGQTSLVSLRNADHLDAPKSTTNLYDQYYVSGYKNYQNAHIRLSADYQRDVLPVLTNIPYSYANAFHYNRLKFNGRADTKVWKGSTLAFGINYTPQTSNYGINQMPDAVGFTQNMYESSMVTQHNLNSNIRLTSEIVPGLTNSLSAAYNHYNYFEKDSSHYTSQTTTFPPENASYYTISHANNGTSNLLINDNLVYHARLGNLSIEPSVDFSYRKVKSSSYFSTIGYANSPDINASIQRSTFAVAPHIYLLTPSLNIFYKEIFDIQGGVVDIVNPDKDFDPSFQNHRISPYVSTSLDVGRLAGLSQVSFHLYGSFSRQSQLTNDYYSTLAGVYTTNNSIIYNGGFNAPGIASFFYSPVDPYKQYNSYQAGAVIDLFKNFTLSYSFEDRYYQYFAETNIPNGITTSVDIIPFDGRLATNRLALNYDYNSGNTDWKTGFNISDSKLHVVNNPTLTSGDNTNYLTNGSRWSGGFTNRFSYQSFFAGFDILYQIGERPYAIIRTRTNGVLNTPATNINSLSLQSLYAGTRVKITHLKYAEIFVNARNILQTKSSDITDNRQFIGLGFKVGL